MSESDDYFSWEFLEMIHCQKTIAIDKYIGGVKCGGQSLEGVGSLGSSRSERPAASSCIFPWKKA